MMSTDEVYKVTSQLAWWLLRKNYLNYNFAKGALFWIKLSDLPQLAQTAIPYGVRPGCGTQSEGVIHIFCRRREILLVNLQINFSQQPPSQLTYNFVYLISRHHG